MARDPEEARRLAADPATDWGTLYELAQTNPEVHADLAANPSTYPDLLVWLGGLGDPAVDAALARRVDEGATEPENGPEAWPDAEPSPGVDETAVAPVLETPTPEVDQTAVAPALETPTPETQVIAPVDEPEAPPAYAPAAAAAAARVPLTVERVPVARSFGVPPEATHSEAPHPETVEPAPALLPTPTASPEETHSRRGLITVLAGVAVLAVIAIVLVLGQGGGEPSATTAPTTEPTATAPTTAAPTTEPTTDPQAALDAATAALTSTFAASQCTDTATDAAALAAWSQARVAVGPWDDTATQAATAAITSLQTRCNAGHAVAVTDQAGAQSPELVAALGGYGWVVPTVAAPAGAADLTAFTSPTGNIACALGEDSVTCSIVQWSFAAPDACPDPNAPVTAVIDGGGARADCSVAPASGGPALRYGSAAAHSHFACTSAQSGVACWDTWTGARLDMARASLGFSGPVFGFSG